MRFVIQRVRQAAVTIDGNIHSQIQAGLLIYMAVHKCDEIADCDGWVDKILKLRIFADDHKPINQSIQSVNGEILLISQFTLYAQTKGQNRPSFMNCKNPGCAQQIYEYFLMRLKQKWPATQAGVFAADMQVHSINDGPITIILE